MPSELHFAVQAGKLAEVRSLITSGVDVNAQDRNGNTPLKYASAEPHPEVMVELILAGARVDLSDRRGFTPLHCVASHGFYSEALEMAKMLLKSGANVNAKSAELGFVPLHEVRTTGMIDLLLAHGANPTLRNEDGQTPAEYLLKEGNKEEAEHLKKKMKNG